MTRVHIPTAFAALTSQRVLETFGVNPHLGRVAGRKVQHRENHDE